MSNEERSQILKMIADGKITAEEGLHLLRALEGPTATPESAPTATPSLEVEPPDELAAAPARGRRLWQFPLWIGVAITLLSAWGMYVLLTASHLNFWFYCLIAPFLLGVALIVLAVTNRAARWLTVDIRQHTGVRPARLFFSFPLPLKWVTWGLRTFGHTMPDVEAAIEVLESGLSAEEPLTLHFREEGDKEVHVYLE